MMVLCKLFKMSNQFTLTNDNFSESKNLGKKTGSSMPPLKT